MYVICLQIPGKYPLPSRSTLLALLVPIIPVNSIFFTQGLNLTTTTHLVIAIATRGVNIQDAGSLFELDPKKKKTGFACM